MIPSMTGLQNKIPKRRQQTARLIRMNDEVRVTTKLCNELLFHVSRQTGQILNRRQQLAHQIRMNREVKVTAKLCQ